jgi:hypothetical protein
MVAFHADAGKFLALNEVFANISRDPVRTVEDGSNRAGRGGQEGPATAILAAKLHCQSFVLRL